MTIGEVRNAGYTWGFRNEGPTFVMGRIMYYDDFKPLLDSMELNMTLKMLVDLGDMDARSVEGGKAQLTIFSLSNEFVEQLKSKSR